jgi:hypothetical protein
MEAIQTIKEGRTLDGESLLVVQAVLDKVTEAYDYLEEGKSMIEQLVGMNPEMPEEVMPEEIAPMAEDSARKISLRLAKAIVNNTK